MPFEASYVQADETPKTPSQRPVTHGRSGSRNSRGSSCLRRHGRGIPRITVVEARSTQQLLSLISLHSMDSVDWVDSTDRPRALIPACCPLPALDHYPPSSWINFRAVAASSKFGLSNSARFKAVEASTIFPCFCATNPRWYWISALFGRMSPAARNCFSASGNFPCW